MKEKQIGEYTISTDKSKLDIDTIHDFLCNHSYWAKGISRQMVEKLNKHCMVVGIYHGITQVGYARVITDFASFAYLSDVFIVENHRKKGLSKQLIQFILEHEELQGLRRFMLATQDAHSLYASFGFKPLNKPEWFMQIHTPTIYSAQAENKK
jgi:N-acetylglutamate synthase-like GNAT family acetyltransferase